MLNKPSVKEAASSRLGAEYFSIIYPCPIPFTATLKKSEINSRNQTPALQKFKNPYTKKTTKNKNLTPCSLVAAWESMAATILTFRPGGNNASAS